MQRYFRENPNFKVAVDQLTKAQREDTVLLFVPTAIPTIGEGLERLLVSNKPAQSVFQEVAKQLETDAKGVKEQVAERV
jgi:sn-glycerol 3-phosphate transport system substrate-binding protein